MNPEDLRPLLEEAGIRGGEAAVNRLLGALQGGGLLAAPESRCPTVLSDLPRGRVPCYDFREVRRAAACFAWNEMRKRHISWQEAIRSGWTAVRRDCTWGPGRVDPSMAQPEPWPF